METLELRLFFDERVGEIKEYMALLEDIESASREGPPRIESVTRRITTSQQRILYSSLYLQLYNLVEATVSRCMVAVGHAIQKSNSRPGELRDELRREWVRSTARTHVDMAPDKRLKHSIQMAEALIGLLPIPKFDVDVGGGGSWDEDAIESAGVRLGCELSIQAPTRTAIKRVMRDEMGALKLVKDRRNGLAHGSLSFVECSDGVSVHELTAMCEAIVKYLDEALQCFVDFIDGTNYLRSDIDPVSGS